MSKSIVTRPNYKANGDLFRASHTGVNVMRPLKHKDGSNLKDWEYLELLGRKCIEMDKQNRNKMLPTNYGQYNRDVCELAKNVCKGVDAGMTSNELTQYVAMCVEYK